MSLTPARRARRSCSKREISARNPWSCTRSSTRSEEHTSELQSPCNLVCRLLLEKKNSIFNLGHSSLCPLWLILAYGAGPSTSYPALIQAVVPPVTLSKSENPAACSRLVAALERYPPAQITVVVLAESKASNGNDSRNFARGDVTARGT